MAEVYENFLALPEEKRRRICTAALREFGRFGYKKTSTEQIAKSAGIAKGMVFHYFGSKRGLFEYLTAYCGDALERWFGNLDAELAGLDFIEQYRCTTKIKLRAFTEEPGVFEFFTMLYLHPENQAVSRVVDETYRKFMAMRVAALAGIYGGGGECFRAGIDPEKAKKYVRWLIEGYAQELMAVFGSRPLADMALDGYWAEFDGILDDMKRLFYKPEQE